MEKSDAENLNEEIIRHFNVIAEDIKNDVQAVAEQVGANTEKLTSLQSSVQRIDETLDIMKLDIGFIKNELKQKVNQEEFALLEKRLSMLETKVSQLA